MTYAFGAAFTRTLFPVQNSLPFQLPTQTPKIYVFETQPSRADAAEGRGAIQTIAAWDQGVAAPYPCTYTISAIQDAQPDTIRLTDEQRRRWEALNFITEANGEGQCLIRSFLMERIEGQPQLPTSSVDDIIKIYPAIATFLTRGQIADFIQIAVDELRIDLENRGYPWARIHNLRNAKLATAYKAIALCSMSQIIKPDDKFTFRYNEFMGKYTAIIQGTAFEVDADADGKPETQGEAAKPYWLMQR